MEGTFERIELKIKKNDYVSIKTFNDSNLKIIDGYMLITTKLDVESDSGYFEETIIYPLNELASFKLKKITKK